MFSSFWSSVRVLARSDEDTSVEKQDDDQRDVERGRRRDDRVDEIRSHFTIGRIRRCRFRSRLAVDAEQHGPVREKKADQPDATDDDQDHSLGHLLLILERILDGHEPIEADRHEMQNRRRAEGDVVGHPDVAERGAEDPLLLEFVDEPGHHHSGRHEQIGNGQ